MNLFLSGVMNEMDVLGTRGRIGQIALLLGWGRRPRMTAG